jgi:DNA-binding SARP family transcriptional activator/tetratricopeptide (TPR) repeat protein
MANPFEIHLLGRPRLDSAGDQSFSGFPKKAYLIAALVALSPRHSCTKAALSELLWPDLSAPQRANNLRQLLFRVRAFEIANDASIFSTTEHDVTLEPGIDCDLTAFEALAGDSGVDLDTVLMLYRGPLLDGVASSGHAIRNWLGDQRLQLEDQLVDIVLTATDALPPDQRIPILTRSIAVAPTAIGLRKVLMRQFIDAGMMQDARRQYREIRHVGGHAAVAAPIELTAQLATSRYEVAYPNLPLAQQGRDLAGVPHIALLPPRGAASTLDDHRIGEDLVDDVTIALTRLRSVSVLAPHTARKVARGEDPSGVGLAHADFVLRTKISAGPTLRMKRPPQMTLLLERVATGDIVWAESVTLDNEAGPAQFAAVANGIALTLVDQIERATLRAFQVPADAGAYGHYLLGQQALQVLDLPSTRRARASFKMALALSPHFAPAHTGFAQSMIYEWIMRGQGDADLIGHARRAAERAREIDPLFGSAYQMLGRASLFEGDFAASLSHFEQAEALNPHHADLLCDLADTLMHSSLPQRANEKIELALKLNPLAPDAYWWASAGIKFFVGEYESALDHLGRVKKSEPVLRLTAACAAMAGQHELAKLARVKFLAIDPSFKLDDWISVLPVREPSHRRHYRQALQKAGFK